MQLQNTEAPLIPIGDLSDTDGIMSETHQFKYRQ